GQVDGVVIEETLAQHLEAGEGLRGAAGAHQVGMDAEDRVRLKAPPHAYRLELARRDLVQDGVAHALEALHRIPASWIDQGVEQREVVGHQVSAPIDVLAATNHSHVVDEQDSTD